MAATTFTEAQVRRAIKGAQAAGLLIGAVEISKSGAIRIIPQFDKAGRAVNDAKPESWDD